MTTYCSQYLYERPSQDHLPQSGLTCEELAGATDWFYDANFLGECGFGSVFKGKLEHGREVTVKRLKRESRQGEREFQVEVDIIGRVHHWHLVSLVGWCITSSERLLDKTLEFHLHGIMLS
ncbi:proline-rich receptor-like protein kinase [Musa troglodytarum]|uniref:non-specific serine/threonine protein kinase n=1 Tax=Musa troglodytarum TaxID=320322 RepID=A0A9E7G7G9_9LILI|nr:proline-rich receptor-like protein kinase [Musa troglodytarum]